MSSIDDQLRLDGSAQQLRDVRDRFSMRGGAETVELETANVTDIRVGTGQRSRRSRTVYATVETSGPNPQITVACAGHPAPIHATIAFGAVGGGCCLSDDIGELSLIESVRSGEIGRPVGVEHNGVAGRQLCGLWVKSCVVEESEEGPRCAD